MSIGLWGGSHYMLGLEKALSGVDIAHTAEIFNLYTIQAIRAKKKFKNMKVVVTVWENIPFLQKNNVTVKFKKEVIDEADHFISITEKARKCLLLEGVKDEKVSVIPMGVDVNIFSPCSKDNELMNKLGFSEDDFIVLFIGRMVWEKGIFVLLTAAKQLLWRSDLDRKKLKFLFVGDGPERKKLERLSIDIRNNVVICPSIDYSKIPSVYSLADIFVLPSIPTRAWQEQFGMVLVEAMASGKAIISTYTGSIPEVLGEAGILIQPADYVSLAESIEKLYFDENLRIKLGAEARKRAVSNFNVNIISEKIKRLYNSLIT